EDRVPVPGSTIKMLAQYGRGGGAVENGCLDAEFGQLFFLVLHERDKRGDDDGDTGFAQGRQLVAQRLATARGHDGQRVMPRHDVVDDFFLAGAQIGNAELLVQDALCLAGGCSIHDAAAGVGIPAWQPPCRMFSGAARAPVGMRYSGETSPTVQGRCGRMRWPAMKTGAVSKCTKRLVPLACTCG